MTRDQRTEEHIMLGLVWCNAFTVGNIRDSRCEKNKDFKELFNDEIKKKPLGNS